MSITRIDGPDKNRQYFQINRLILGKKDIVSVHNSKADIYEKLRNDYEDNYTDKKGKRYIVSYRELRWGLYGGIPGALSGYIAAEKFKSAWKSNKHYKLLNTLLFASLGYIKGMVLAQTKEFIDIHQMRKMETDHKAL